MCDEKMCSFKKTAFVIKLKFEIFLFTLLVPGSDISAPALLAKSAKTDITARAFLRFTTPLAGEIFFSNKFVIPYK